MSTPAPHGVHLPPPSVWPLTLAIGLTGLLTGLVFSPPVAIVGGLISVGSVGLWVRDARRELDRLPEHE